MVMKIGGSDRTKEGIALVQRAFKVALKDDYKGVCCCLEHFRDKEHTPGPLGGWLQIVASSKPLVATGT